MFEFDLTPGFRPGSTCRAWRAARTAPGGEGGTGGAGGGGGGGDTGATGGTGGNAKTFTQEELDRIVGQRVGEERAKYTDYDKYKADSTELAGIKDKDKSADQRHADLQRQLDEEKAARAKAEKDRDDDREAARLEKLRVDRAEKKEGFPVKLAKRLTATTEAEIDAEIEELMTDLGITATDRRPDGSGGSSRTGGNETKPSTMAAGGELYEKLHGKKK